MGYEELLKIAEISNRSFYSKNFEETKMYLMELENSITSNCMESGFLDLNESFYKQLISIIEDVGKKAILNYFSDFDIIELEIAKSSLVCLRNSFFKNTVNQNLVGKNEHNTRAVADFLLTLIRIDSRYCKDYTDNKKNIFFKTLSACITYFVNLISGNSTLRKIVWETLQLLYMDIVCLSNAEVNHVGAALIHQFLVEDDLKQNICRDGKPALLLQHLLNAYLRTGPYACFSLYCIEILIESEIVITSAWGKLKPEESLLLLDILSTNVKNTKVSMPVLSFFKEFFKNEADKILRTFRDVSTTADPQVIIRVATFICSCAASDHYRNFLQEDRSLLISSVYLLKGITQIGETFDNHFTRVNDVSATDEMKSHPVFGFKSDLIRLIAALVYQNRDNQDVVRDADGILLILENSQYDARNPLIREACIFAIRNLLERNEENQKVIADLQLKGPAKNETLSKLGIEVAIENGKISLHQKS